MKQFILLASGPLCSGKSMLAEVFMKNDPRIFRVSFDTVKRLISDFDSERDRSLVMRLTFKLAQEAINEGLSVYVEGSASIFKEMRGYFTELSEKKGLKFIEINLEAPLDVLLSRLEERVQSGKAMVVKNKDQFMRRYNLYLEHKDNNVSVYDTEKYTAESIYNLVRQELL